MNRGQHASRQDNFAVFYVILNRRTSSTPQSSALKTTKFSLPEVEESGTPRLRPCKALDRRVLDVRGARVTQQGHNLGAPDRVVPCPPTLTYFVIFGAMREIIPTINSTGNAILTSPTITRPIKSNGSSTTVHIIFEIPQAALTANPSIFPNITSISIININVNISYLPSRFQLFCHKLCMCLQAPVFHCRLFVHAFSH